MFDTPILFLIFNRPDLTQIVFAEIKKQRPKKIFIAADGPRENIIGEFERCAAARKIVLNGIDWDCEVQTLFRNENLGCGRAVSGAIDWFFENVEQGIILEDDCLPHPDFFKFCHDLLNKYKNHEEIFAISGNNFQNGIQRSDASYYFSKYVFIWGWATWRKAWEFYDFDMKELTQFKKSKTIRKINKRRTFQDYWFNIFEEVANKNIDTWDYQWTFSIWKNNGLTIVPNVNLVSNIGFGGDATHTTEDSPLADLEINEIGVIRHPTQILIDKMADDFATKFVYQIKESKKNLIQILLNNLRRIYAQI